MDVLACDIGMASVRAKSRCCIGFFNKKKCDVSGRFRARDIEISSQRSNSASTTFSKKIIVKAFLKKAVNGNVLIRWKPFFYTLYKIFSHNVYCPKHKMFNDKIAFSTNNCEILDNVLMFEEIRDAIDSFFDKHNRCIIMACNNYVVYSEQYNFMTRSRRLRIKNATELICDIADAIDLIKY